MATSIETLKKMDDGHAIAVLRAEMDDLTSTPLEIFLLDWVESLIDNGTGVVQEKADEYEIDAPDLEKLGDALIQNAVNSAAILSAVGDAGLDTPEAVKAAIEFHQQFRDLVDEAGDLIPRFTALINQAKE